ncbi:hypothetical protein CN918_32705 [Priestia megaterium]|nr:hypothetical protein CN918_32705 [Priestia megaterium]
MHRLSKHSKPSQTLVMTQLLIFKNKCELHHIEFAFIHKFLIKLTIDTEVAYLRVNLIDMEFFFVSSKKELETFMSFCDFRQWFERHYFMGVDRSGT